MTSLTEQAFQEGFARRQRQLAVGLVKAAVPSRLPMFIDPRKARLYEESGKNLFHQVRNDTGLLGGLRASMLGGYEKYDRLGWLRDNYTAQMRALQKQLRTARAVGSTTAERAIMANMQKAKTVFNTTAQRMHQEIGATAEGRAPLIDVGLPVAGTAMGVGATAYGAGNVFGGRDQRRQDMNQMAQMPLMQRLKNVFVPQSVAMEQFGRPQ